MAEANRLDAIVDDITSACAAAFGNETVSESLASTLRAKLPYATFVRCVMVV